MPVPLLQLHWVPVLWNSAKTNISWRRVSVSGIDRRIATFKSRRRPTCDWLATLTVRDEPPNLSSAPLFRSHTCIGLPCQTWFHMLSPSSDQCYATLPADCPRCQARMKPGTWTLRLSLTIWLLEHSHTSIKGLLFRLAAHLKLTPACFGSLIVLDDSGYHRS